jgi:histidinol dehydrogenase
MAQWLDAADPHFESKFTALLGAKREASADVGDAVAAIVADVKARGDQAVIELTAKFDRFDPRDAAGLKLPMGDAPSVPEKLQQALAHAKTRLEDFHARHKPQDDWYTDKLGVGLGARWTPVDAVALYTPGGKAAYPSSFLMNAVPAIVAGVPRMVLVTPTPRGETNATVLAAAKMCGVVEAYRIGGAQAVAALTFGTQTIRPADKIVGPGNAYVAAAKRQLFGQVGIDSIAGPSEVVIVADGKNVPAWIAMDLMAQAEHDEAAQSILITDDANFARTVMMEVEKALTQLPRAQMAAQSWRDNGAVVLVKKLAEAAPLVDRLAPEHLQIATSDPHAFAKSVRHAGAIFLGAHTPEAIGDYIAGPNHVLPTSRTARFASGLSVLDFMKRTTMIECPPGALSALAADAVALAEAEGLDAHARSISIRTNR